MKRSKFLKQMSTALVLALPLVALTTSCSEEAVPPNTPPPAAKDCLANGTTSSIGSNHGHSLTVSKNDIENGVAKTYIISGTSSHTHQATISAADFAALKNNNSITVTSTSDNGHNHSVSVSCA